MDVGSNPSLINMKDAKSQAKVGLARGNTSGCKAVFTVYRPGTP